MEMIDLQNNKHHSWKIAILGFGVYGRALAQSFNAHNIPFTMGTNQKQPADTSLANGKTMEQTQLSNVIGPHGTFDTYSNAVIGSTVVFLALPAHAHQSIVEPLKNHLNGKTVVDVSNLEKSTDPSNASRLQEILPTSFIVKALNTVSAYTLEQAQYGASRDTYVCGNDRVSCDNVSQILREIGLNPVHRGTLGSAWAVEKLQFQFFPGWGTAIGITFMTLLPIWIYSYLYIFWYNSDAIDSTDIGLYEGNRIIAWTMFWALGLVYLPGILAGFIQIYKGSKYTRFPRWLDAWLKCRKQLGLICLFMASIHACASCLLIGAGELKHMTNVVQSAGANKPPIVVYQQLSAKNQWSLMCACLSLGCLCITGVTSLPSVNARMSWMEWDFVQRGIGFAGFCFGFTHVMVYVSSLWDPDYQYGWMRWKTHSKGVFPPGAFVMPMFPLLVIALKVVLMLPGVSCHLNRIRRGRVGYRSNNSSNNNAVPTA